MMTHSKTFLTLAVAATATGLFAQSWDPFSPTARGGSRPSKDRGGEVSYMEAIDRTAQMVSNQEAQSLTNRFGLNLLNVTWEDTGRYKGSSVGPNISDMTIQVANEGRAHLMPVIRFPNFSDVTGDLSPDAFSLMVGNQKGGRMQRVSLTDYLENPTLFMSDSNSWKGARGKLRTLLADRDDKVLVSAQACFLPIPQSGKATFNPVLFNYQSRVGDPAVLTILATRQGTSMTVIDNQRDGFNFGGVWGQRLFHNKGGRRASLTGERVSDLINRGGDGSGASAKDPGLNMVLLIQVPLKQKTPMRDQSPGLLGGGAGGYSGAPAMESAKAGRGSNVENAVIGHGRVEGPYTEVDNLSIERDERFPIRVTVQFYKATSNGVVSPQDMAEIKKNIDGVYGRTENVGSLVTGGNTGRPTEYWGLKVQPRDWWQNFWRKHQLETGDDPQTAIRKLRRLMGDDYMSQPVSRLYVCDMLRR